MHGADHAHLLRAPFPYFGGKSRIAAAVWDRLGDVPNYVEPFCGSAAVLLARPHRPKIETLNDANCFIANFWRALQHDPESVAHHADWPVNEADLHARHRWLVTSATSMEWRERMKSDPHYYDAQIAGWWVWGASCWIGGGWCKTISNRRPQLASSNGVCRAAQITDIRGWFLHLRDRLRCVRVTCGDWRRVVTPSVTHRIGLTAVFLDPPYSRESGRDPDIYSTDDINVAHRVREWAIEHGERDDMRIALCGYEGEHEMPASWTCLAWRAQGGYAHIGKGHGRTNRLRERIWFSPHCLKAKQGMLL